MRRLVVPLAACLVLAGCAPTVSLTPAPDATAVGCARVVVGIRQVDAIGAAQRRSTDAQGTAAWGTPAAVTLYCGVETPQASALPCFTVSDVDWLVQTVQGRQVLTTYGRDPGVQLIVTSDVAVGDAVQAVSDAVDRGTRESARVCSSGQDGTPAPAPSATP